MKHTLKISFSQKDSVKALARANNTRIQWDSADKVWFWEGAELPEFLTAYSDFGASSTTAAPANSQYFYLCQENTREWWTVEEGPFNSKAELKSAAVDFCKRFSGDDGIIVSNVHIVVSGRRIRKDKNINSRWIIALQHLRNVQDPALKAAYDSATAEYLED